MERINSTKKENSVDILNEVSKLVHCIEQNILNKTIKAKECEELKILKQKCCDKNPIVSLTGFHGIINLVEKKILVPSQTVSMLVSLLPSIHHFGALVSTIGNVLLFDLQIQTSGTGDYEWPYNDHVQHPFILILKYNRENSWVEIYHFVLQLMQEVDYIKVEHKIKFLRPVFHQIFWSSSWGGSHCQLKLFNTLILESGDKKIMKFVLELLLWKELDIHYCLFLQDFFIHLLKQNSDERNNAVSGMMPALALATRWLILNGYNPHSWLKILRDCIKLDDTSNSTILFILSEVIMETPSVYINQLVDVCKSIIFTTHCNKYAVHKFVAGVLNWLSSPSFLANPVYKVLEEVLEFIPTVPKWKDQTKKLITNEYYRVFGNSKSYVRFSVDLMLASNSWSEEKSCIVKWLTNLIDSNEHEMQFALHSFIHGIILSESDVVIVNLCLDILFSLIERHKEISFSLLCLLFYKLGRERDPTLQKIYLFSLPKLSVKKENIPLIVGIIESLKRGTPRIMTPLIIQLYLSLWKFDGRTYSYLHKMLHGKVPCDSSWEVNVSKAVALKEICRLSPHLHAKDLVGVLSKILNESSASGSGLPSAIAIEAVTDLCKAYVIDVAGTWNAIQPKLRVDKRPEVISSLCKFFGGIPTLSSLEQENDELIKDIVSMIWDYTFFNDPKVVRIAFRALAKFPIENLPLNLLPESYRMDIKLPKNLEKNEKSSEDILNLSYVPAECWLQLLQKINTKVLQDCGQLIGAFLERELSSMPRGLFYLPPEKSEPLNYSYLPPTSICRCLVEFLQRRSKENPEEVSEYLKEILRILSAEYSKHLPPLNWIFLETFMALGWQLLSYCLALLAKQASVSASAKCTLENYFKTVKWDSEKLEEILFIYNLLPLLCKGVSYSTLQNIFEKTLSLCLETTLKKRSTHFGELLQSVTETFKNKSIQPSHKKLLAKQLEKILILIPPEHDVMKNFANCATEFPVQLVQELTSVKENDDMDVLCLRRAVVIRAAIAMRSDIKNPLAWFNDFLEAVAHFTQEKNYILSTIWFTIRSRRACDHRIWLQELTWRIQASITNSNSRESTKVTLFLVDVFVTVVIILSGHDHLFMDICELTTEEAKKLQIFPQALCFLLSFPDWNNILPKVGLWIQKMLKWKNLPEDRVKMFTESLLFLREIQYYVDDNEASSLFKLFVV